MELEKRVEELEKRVAALDVRDPEQLYRGVCPVCNSSVVLKQVGNLIPRYCYICGKLMDYSLSKLSSSSK